MGDRRMAEIRTEYGNLYIYTHWSGEALPRLAEDALRKARPRLGDEAYWTRIVVDQITKSARDKETGFGLMLTPDAEDEYNNDKPSVIIDADKGTVTEIVDGERKLESFWQED